MQAIDAAAVAREGASVLMTRAGAAIAALIPRYARASGPIVALAGPGNNGGDAFAALAALDATRERVVYHDPSTEGSSARRGARERARNAGVVFRPFPVEPAVLARAALLLDGLLGAGARLPLDEAIARHATAMRLSGAPVLALDVPTGLDPTTGNLDGAAPHAVATIALGAPKRGCFLDPGRSAVGDLWCAALAMHDEDADGLGDDTFVLDDAEFAALLPHRAADADKRSAGAPLVIAGSAQFPGAAVLCARGAARAGAGYVTVVAPEAAAATLRAQLVEQVVVTCDETDPPVAIATILDLAKRSGAIAIGPGLGLSAATGEIVRGVVAGSDLPMVIDASALFHLAKHLAIVREKPIVVTPHAGEFARLSGGGTVAPAERLARVRAFVNEHRVVTLLKGRTTIVADVHAAYFNPTGTPALATAGTGDVLTGIIATLLSQGLAPVDAARAGAYWHGRAGFAAAEKRPIGVIAGDIPEFLADAARVDPERGTLTRIF
jgi:hydroxyethylthiazole kinase-like uncharacterized protein yjeF